MKSTHSPEEPPRSFQQHRWGALGCVRTPPQRRRPEEGRWATYWRYWSYRLLVSLSRKRSFTSFRPSFRKLLTRAIWSQAGTKETRSVVRTIQTSHRRAPEAFGTQTLSSRSEDRVQQGWKQRSSGQRSTWDYSHNWGSFCSPGDGRLRKKRALTAGMNLMKLNR